MTTFAIAMFVLVMKVLWHYIDKIAGKGLGLLQIIELIAYKSASLVQLALPLAILISTVMVIGRFAEQYELNSCKAAGVSLVRIMYPLLLFGLLGTGGSYLCNNYLIPAANIQFATRMYDIQQKKPTLNLVPGTFNEDFANYAILIGQKSPNGQSISSVQIYDHSKAERGQISQITADSGKMYTTNDGEILVMELQHGHQYAESTFQADKSPSDSQYPYVRTAFQKYSKVFNLSEFQLSTSNPSLFDQDRSMLTTTQLHHAIDSIDLEIRNQKRSIDQYLPNILVRRPDKPTSATTSQSIASLPQPPWLGFKQLFNQLDPALQSKILHRSRAQIRTILSQSNRLNRSIPAIEETRVKHTYSLQMKYSMALVCFIFVLIGAPMGAIVRKGGFGYPILVSIIFFIAFIVLTIFCRKLAESFVLDGLIAGWMPCLLLFPFGLWLTIMANNDRQLNILLFFQNVFESITKLLPQRKTDAPPPLDAK